RRRPVRPLRLPGDAQEPLPLKSVTANADTVTQRAAAGLDQIEMALGGGNDDRARRFRGAVVHHLLLPFRIELVGIVGHESGLVAGVGALPLRAARRGRKNQADRGNHHPAHATKFRHQGSPRGMPAKSINGPSNLRGAVMASFKASLAPPLSPLNFSLTI